MPSAGMGTPRAASLPASYSAGGTSTTMPSGGSSLALYSRGRSSDAQAMATTNSTGTTASLLSPRRGEGQGEGVVGVQPSTAPSAAATLRPLTPALSPTRGE